MSVTTQAALLGFILALGLICIVLRFAPARASLSDAMSHLTDTKDERYAVATHTDDTVYSKVGTKLYPHIGGIEWIKFPTADLAILQISPQRFLGNKVIAALVGLAFPAVAQLLLTVLAGASLSWSIPTVAALALAAALFFAPDVEVRKNAAAAREEASRGLGAFIEFVSLNRTGGVGAVQSLERAAVVGESWVFRRIDEELQKAQRAGKAPWETLNRLSTELDLPDLGDLVDIMTLTGEHGASVSETLSATAASLRNAQLAKELGAAGSATEKLQAPLAMLGVIFVALLTIAAVGNIAVMGA